MKFFEITLTILLITLALTSCKSDSVRSYDGNLDEFYQVLTEDIDRLDIIFEQTIDVGSLDIYIPMHPILDMNGNIILVNGADWTIHQINTSGELLATVGKFGSGPREFRMINSLSMGSENMLYALDAELSRVTVYSVTNSDISFEKSIAFTRNNNSQSNIQISRDFFRRDSLYYGVGISPRPNRGVNLVKFDDELISSSTLFDFPLHFPDIFGGNSRLTNQGWSMNSDDFIYFYYDSLVVNMFNPGSSKQRRVLVLESHFDRFMNETNIAHMKEAFGYEATSRVKLPILIRAFQYGDTIITDVAYYGGDKGLLLHHDLKSGVTSYILTPPDFYLSAFRENTLVGILVDRKDGNSLHLIKLNK